MSQLSEVYSAIKRVQSATTAELRELLQAEYSSEWTSKNIEPLSVEKTIGRRLNALVELELVKKEKEGKANIYSIVHNFPVKSRAPELMEQVKDIFKENEALYAKAQKPILELLNEIKSPYYIRQNVEDISSKEEIIKKLEYAINGSNYINITYNSKIYKVQPIKIAEFEGIWYLLLYHEETKSYRKYRLIDTTNVEILKDQFSLSEKQTIDITDWHNVWHQPGKKPTRIKLWIGEWVVKYFHQKNIFDINSYPKRVLPCSDGIEYELFITHIFELLPQIMYWQPHIVILEQEGEIDAQAEFMELLKRTTERQESFTDK